MNDAHKLCLLHSFHDSLCLIHMLDLFIYLYYILSQIKSITTTSQTPLESSCTYWTSVNKDRLCVSGSVQDAKSMVHLSDTSPNFNWLPHSQQSSLLL